MRVDYIDHMGSDLTVVNSARVSFSKTSDWEYEDVIGHLGYNEFLEGKRPVLSEKDTKLIKYLAKNNHWTPFSHVQITMRETVPIFVARQRFKHMVGFTYNEVSRRYVDDPPEFYIPKSWRKRAENAKQGSSNEEIEVFQNSEVLIMYEYGENISTAYKEFLQRAEFLYKDMINSGVAPEQARMVLPQSMYTSYYVTGSLAAWARAYKLRIDGHAQKEIQDLAKQWDTVISSIPELSISWSVLKE